MKMKNNFLHKQEVNLPHFVKTKYVHVLQKKCSYISTSSTTSTLRLPLYIFSVVDAYQKAYGTGKRVMVMVMMVLQGTYVL